MKKIIAYLILILITSNLQSFGQKKYIIGAEANGLLPIGTLSERFENTFGGSVYFGQQMTEKWAWTGKFEMFEFDKVNSEKLYKKVSTVFNNVTKTYKVPLNKMKMNLSVIGISAEGKYRFIELNGFSSNINIGFGIYNWKSIRNTYKDSLFVDTSGTGTLVNVENLDVPRLSQVDWSGGITFGLDFVYYFIEPVAIVLSGNYKLIIAELWPTLRLNLENVSGIQMFDLRVGLRYRF
jgi:hypothetical protein